MTVTSPADAEVVASRRPRARRGVSLRDTGPSIALVVVVVVFAALSPGFRTLSNVQNVMDAAAVLAVVTCGVTFVLMTGSIDLSAPGIMGASAIAVALLVANNRNDLDLGLLGVVVAVLLAAALGCLSGLALVALKVPSFMTTLGVSAVGLGVATLMFAGVQPNITDGMLEGWAVDRTLGLSHLTWIAVACVLVGWSVQRWTRLGRYAYAIGGAEEVLALSGVRVAPYKVAVFTMAGAFYGLAGVMVTSQLGAGLVQAGKGYDFSAITAAVVGGTLLSGGRGGVLHSTVGVLLVTVLTNGLVQVGVSPYWQGGVQGLIVVAAVAAAVIPQRRRNQVTK
ncbi:monosaccharide ABC transporter membrane protein (CUT2 family) [Isoptericola jiangsuensis]|uniref:Monosaccharide ABC transporter membrane protein (CUT2 family) n=1 Tax=Isoptericola jiangsuensis TaxID=548579 RepID=A0A2A9F2S8_9MICO|nr:ABC transporter permease [Isoptericola jiangsuensis]PFG44755.1 monosaccharide ABC transporter membrane protein (CUT2 family) [Isoptericola jiangsuensis]